MAAAVPVKARAIVNPGSIVVKLELWLVLRLEIAVTLPPWLKTLGRINMFASRSSGNSKPSRDSYDSGGKGG